MSPCNSNVNNICGKIDKVLRTYFELEEKSQKMGYSSLPNAIKALRMSSDKGILTDELYDLPEIFHNIPFVWLSGKAPVKNIHPGFPPMSVKQAERAHRGMAHLIVEAWGLAKGEPDIRDAMERDYLSFSAEAYEKELFKYIYNLEEVTVESELQQRTVTNMDINSSLKVVADSRNLYGAGAGSLEPPVWD